MKNLKIAFMALALSACVPVAAPAKTYIGADASFHALNGGSATPLGADFHVGQTLTDYAAVELGYGTFQKQDLKVQGPLADTYFFFPLAGKLKFFGTAGLQYVDVAYNTYVTTPILTQTSHRDYDWQVRAGGGLAYGPGRLTVRYQKDQAIISAGLNIAVF